MWAEDAAQRLTKVGERKGAIMPAGAAWTSEMSACRHGLEQGPAVVDPACDTRKSHESKSVEAPCKASVLPASARLGNAMLPGYDGFAGSQQHLIISREMMQMCCKRQHAT